MLIDHDATPEVCVITGATSGVGRATALALTTRGVPVVLACRSAERATAVTAEIEAATGTRPRWIMLDLEDLSSVRRAAAALEGERIGVLINNAGVGGLRGTTRDGFEMAFGTNYLGHYLFTRLLLPGLARGGRIVHLGSGSYARVRDVDLARVKAPTRSLTGVREYSASKLAVMRFHHELARRFEERGADALSLVADPGDVASNAWRHVPWLVRDLWTRGMRTPAEGARASVFCATAPSLTNGGCFQDEQRFVPTDRARDDAAARALWDQSATWCGLSTSELEP